MLNERNLNVFFSQRDFLLLCGRFSYLSAAVIIFDRCLDKSVDFDRRGRFYLIATLISCLSEFSGSFLDSFMFFEKRDIDWAWQSLGFYPEWNRVG